MEFRYIRGCININLDLSCDGVFSILWASIFGIYFVIVSLNITVFDSNRYFLALIFNATTL